MARNLFKAARRDIAAVRQANRLDLLGDYTATQSQIESIYRNLGTATAGVGANLTSMQARQLAALQRISGKGTSAAARVNARAARQAVNRYGTAMGPAVQQQLGPAQAAAKATGMIAKGQVQAGSMLAKAGQTALATQQSATAEAQAAAEYATAVAMKSRGQQDAAQVAQMQFELQKMKLDNRYALQQMERQYQLQYKYDQKAKQDLLDTEYKTSGAAASMTNASTIAADAYVTLQRIFNTPMEDGHYPSAAEAFTVYMAQQPTPDPYAQAFIQNLAANMYAAGAGAVARGAELRSGDNTGEWLGAGGLYGAGASDQERQQLMEDSITESIVSQWPQYAEHASEIAAAVHSHVVTASTRQAIDSATAASGGSDKSWIEGVVDFGMKYALPVAGLTVGILTAQPEIAAGAFAASAAYSAMEKPGNQYMAGVTAGLSGGVTGYAAASVVGGVLTKVGALSGSKIGLLSKTGNFFEGVKNLPTLIRTGGLKNLVVNPEAFVAANAAKAEGAAMWSGASSGVAAAATGADATAAAIQAALPAAKTVSPAIAKAVGTSVDEIVTMAYKAGVTPEYLGRLILQAKNGSQKATDILVAILSNA
jgi:hypothetical protein